MNNIVERLRETYWRAASETNDEAKVRRQRERNEAASQIERLRAALEPFACRCSKKGEGAGGTCLAPGGICRAWNARAALESPQDHIAKPLEERT